jgi:hypothetical protein
MQWRTVWIVAGIFAVILLVAGLTHIAFMTTAQLYLNMKEVDEKQTKYIIGVDKRVDEMERKLSLFEQHLRQEKRNVQEK